jgi:hypothetical protein
VWKDGGGELGIEGVLEMLGVSIREEAEDGRPVLKLYEFEGALERGMGD